ncbi:Protein DGCR14 [Neolecta irregularis DAH-3]|uniref:Protein DGCR14 n=1 Tax=Neolecta irregularis (strain DAH-3) TaxID=1198029 RepID=A0A1U7LG50_NEOID|nr:Protein DGCR14 [Neolecta irregularis DAH-3]|eukprot:OLL21630.1 Protein DGCR14 [Neolecta irregularis DAH-3]
MGGLRARAIEYFTITCAKYRVRSMSDSTELAVRPNDNTITAAVPPLKKLKRPAVVLEEDEYIEALSKIIERDFFPQLAELRAYNEYMDALQSKNAVWIESSARRLANPEQPKEKDTEKYDMSKRLDTFQAMYTSEDNASFIGLLDHTNEQRRKARQWAWEGNRIKNNSRTKDNHNQIACIDNRPASVQSWNHNPMNSLMYFPEGIDEPLVCDRSAPKVISHAATRLQTLKDTLEEPALSKESSTVTSTNEPSVRGYTFVDPEAAPAELGAPPLTWGSIESTPLRITRTPGFKMQEMPRRDILASKLVDKNSKSRKIPKFSSGPDLKKAMMSPAGQRLLGMTSGDSNSLRTALRTPARSRLKEGWTVTPKGKM